MMNRKAEKTAVHAVQPIAQPCFVAHPADKIGGSSAEEIHAYDEQRAINDTGYQYPFPQFMFLYKPVGLEIRLYAYDHFFQHIG
jgi:hypothetical protein